MKPALPVLAALMLLAATPALAAPAATPLQTEMAGRMLEFNDFKSQVQLGMESATLPQSLLATRPGWPLMFKAAVGEELEHDLPVIQSMVAQALGKAFTDGELKVGLKIVSDPNLRAIYIAAQNGGRVPDVRIARDTEDALATPAGQSFASKLQGLDSVMQPLLVEVTATLVPGVLRRFGEKAEAAEVRTRADAGYAAPR